MRIRRVAEDAIAQVLADLGPVVAARFEAALAADGLLWEKDDDDD